MSRQGFSLFGDLDGLRHGPGATGVDRERDVRADRLARGGDFRDADFVQLDVAVAARDRCGAVVPHHIGVAVAQQAGIGRHALDGFGAAEQAIERLAGALAGDVPQRDVERRQRETDRPVARAIALPVGDVAHQRRNVGRVAADRERRNGVLHRDLGDAAGGEAKTLAPADEAFIGRHLDEQRLHIRPLRRRGVLGGIAEVVGHADMERLYGGDFHRLNFDGLRKNGSMPATDIMTGYPSSTNA